MNTPDQPSQHTFDLHLPGLLKVLAEHLYSNRNVGIRELIQNAVDSCTRRQIQEGDGQYEPRIDLEVDEAAGTLTIYDNGSGLNLEEIHQFLSTIGRGYTRVLREDLALFSPEAAEQLIGQFGLGFLSAFLLASKVEVVTSSIDGSSPLLWTSCGDENYEVVETSRDSYGTTVVMHLKSQARHFLNPDVAAGIICQYADFLPVPIYWLGERVMLNRTQPPWQDDNAMTSIGEYLVEQYGAHNENPLLVVPLSDWPVQAGQGQITVPLAGFLFVPTNSVASIQEHGDLAIYIRRMFICDGERKLLPAWAKFVRGVVECSMLQPTASREDLHQDECFLYVRQALEEQLLEALKQVAQTDVPRWRQILAAHADVIMGWVVKEHEFFDSVADEIAVRTSRGRLTMPEYLKQSGNKVYLVSQQFGSMQAQLLAEGRDVPVIDATWFAVRPFLAKYADRFEPPLELIELDSDSQQLLTPVEDDRFSLFIEEMRGQSVRAVVSRFEPAAVPALMVYPEDARFLKDTQEALDEDEIPDGLAGLIGEYMESQKPNDEMSMGTLHFNVNSVVVQQLAQLDPNSEAFRAGCTLLYQLARLLEGRMLDAREAVGAFRDASSAVKSLLDGKVN